MTRKSPNFERAPVEEVVCGVSFDRIPGFTAPYLGVLWRRYINEYPKTEHAVPLGLQPSMVVSGLDDMPFPRVWFIHREDHMLIQVQADRFLFNWRRRENFEYPRFPNVIERFRAHLNSFVEFLSENGFEEPNINSAELTYLNHIPKNEGWTSAADIHSVIPDICWTSAAREILPEPEWVAWRAAFKLPERMGLLTAKVDRAKRTTDQQELLVLDLTAKGNLVESGSELWNWFDCAHEWIVWGFVDLTSRTAQYDLWGRTE